MKETNDTGYETKRNTRQKIDEKSGLDEKFELNKMYEPPNDPVDVWMSTYRNTGWLYKKIKFWFHKLEIVQKGFCVWLGSNQCFFLLRSLQNPIFKVSYVNLSTDLFTSNLEKIQFLASLKGVMSLGPV